jgi:hypothetical protein
MSTDQTTTAADLNAATATARVAQATAVVAGSRPTAPAKRPSAATRKSAQSAKTGAKVAGAKRTTGRPAAPKPATPAKVTTPRPAVNPTQVKRLAASALVTVIGDAYGKLTDAQIRKMFAPVKVSDAEVKDARTVIGLTWASALNYIPTPAGVWSPKLPDRKFTGGRGAKARTA